MIALLFLSACVAARLISQILLTQQLSLEKELWNFLEAHVEFKDDGDSIIYSRHNTTALYNTRVSTCEKKNDSHGGTSKDSQTRI